MSMVNTEVQTVLFSATMGQEVNKLTAATTRKPIRVSADPDNVQLYIYLENGLEIAPASNKAER